MKTNYPTLVEQGKMVFRVLGTLGHRVVRNELDQKYRVLSEGGSYGKAYDSLDNLIESTFEYYVKFGFISKGAN